LGENAIIDFLDIFNSDACKNNENSANCWFAVGLKNDDNTFPNTNNYRRMRSTNYDRGSQPLLEVQYNMPVLYWKFDSISDGITPDTSPNAFSGNLFNNPSLTSDAQVGQAFDFAGNNYVWAADASGLDQTKFTLSLWFKTTDTSATNSVVLAMKGYFTTGTDVPGENINYGVWLTTAGKIRGGFEDNVNGGDNFVITPSTYDYRDGNYHHVVLTYDGQTLILYVDNAVKDTRSTTATPETNDKQFRVGQDPGNLNRYFIGKIDAVRIYGDALTAAEIDRLYDQEFIGQTGGPREIT
jgi:hypothetical protein